MCGVAKGPERKIGAAAPDFKMSLAEAAHSKPASLCMMWTSASVFIQP